jgi:uncharacterized membrane protein YccC
MAAPAPVDGVRSDSLQVGRTLGAAWPPLFFGLRLWVAVCLALYVAFELELDNAFWAGTTAAIVCQPSLGASLRKGAFRMIGTVIGAVATVALTASFPQDPIGFLAGLAIWCAACALVATVLRNFAQYAAALAGYTTVIIGSDVLGATGGASGEVFMLAITRASEICIGIVCAGVVLAGTDLGSARSRLTNQLGAILAGLVGTFPRALLLAGAELSTLLGVWRDLFQRTIALEPVLDEALGESFELHRQLPFVRAALGGLFVALAGWRMAAHHLELMPGVRARREAELVHRGLSSELRATSVQVDPSRLRSACTASIRALASLRGPSPSLRLLADQTAETLLGVRHALDGLLVLTNAARPVGRPRAVGLPVADWLPALLNAIRAFVTIGAIELFWVVTAWPSGAQAMIFIAVAVILFAPRGDQAYTMVIGFTIGTGLTAAVAAVVKFAVLPDITTFVGFSLAIGMVLVPAGALIAQPWRTPMFMAIVINFLPLLGPANPVSFDPQQFYNVALACILGTGAAGIAFRLLPPLPPAVRARRLALLTLRDLRRLATGSIRRSASDWQRLAYSRLIALPEQPDPGQRAQLVAALRVGTEIIRLRCVAGRFGLEAELEAALDALVQGDSRTTAERLAAFDRSLAAVPATRPGGWIRLRARGGVLAMSQALAEHAAYFDAGAAR